MRKKSVGIFCGIFLFAGAQAVSVTDATDEGHVCFKVTTDNATYFYQKNTAGFTSILDNNGKDWISHNSRAGSGSAGEYRGLPNLGDCCHPGNPSNYASMTSTITVNTSSQVSIRSISSDGKWEVTFDFYPTYTTLKVLKAGANYWFLYEGTPGGTFSAAADYYVKTDGVKKACSASFNGDIPGSKPGTGEWIYFGDNAVNRVLFLVNHTDDSHNDQFWQMNGDMTVFGFGRQYTCCAKYMSGQNTFTFGFMETTNHATIKAFIESGFSTSSPVVTKEDVMGEIKGYKAGTKTVGVVQGMIDKYVKEEAK